MSRKSYVPVFEFLLDEMEGNEMPAEFCRFKVLVRVLELFS